LSYAYLPAEDNPVQEEELKYSEVDTAQKVEGKCEAIYFTSSVITFSTGLEYETLPKLSYPFLNQVNKSLKRCFYW